MHDPMTVAFEIKYPWRKYPKGHQWFKDGYRESFITIWHIDPERCGDDDSCDWFGRKRKLNEKEEAIVEAMWDLETLLDNRPHFPDSPEHKAFQVLKKAVWDWKRVWSWRIHPRWHVWHWSFQIHPWQKFRRWVFDRCSKCGKGFKFGETVYSGWSGSEIWHEKCSGSGVASASNFPAENQISSDVNDG